MFELGPSTFAVVGRLWGYLAWDEKHFEKNSNTYLVM